MRYGYVKGKTEGTIERQLNFLKQCNLDEIVIEKSGKDLEALLDKLQTGDELHIEQIERLTRSLSKMVEITETIKKKGATLCVDRKNVELFTRLCKSFMSM